jgi:hypothetical protein
MRDRFISVVINLKYSPFASDIFVFLGAFNNSSDNAAQFALELLPVLHNIVDKGVLQSTFCARYYEYRANAPEVAGLQCLRSEEGNKAELSPEREEFKKLAVRTDNNQRRRCELHVQQREEPLFGKQERAYGIEQQILLRNHAKEQAFGIGRHLKEYKNRYGELYLVKLRHYAL